MMRSRFKTWLVLLLVASAARADEAFEQALRLARDPADTEDLQALVDQGVARGGSEASAWELLDLWIELERDRAEDPLVEWKAWRERWPDSAYLPWTDWWCARALVRRQRPAEALALLPDVAATAPEPELRRRAQALADALLDGRLPASEAEALAARLAQPGKDWLLGRLGGRRIHRRIGLVLPLKGADAEAGRQLLAGAEAALKALPGWSLDLADCESDPVLALVQMRALAASGEVDALIVPGDPACVAAAGFGSSVPVLLPWYEGQPIADADDALFQFNADETTLARGWAALIADSLDARQVISFAPATRRGRRLVEATLAELRQRRPDIETGMPQWYFPGARDLRRQLENMAIYESSFDTLSVSLVVGREEDMEILVPQLAWANPRHWIVGGSAFLTEGARVPELASLGGQLLVLGDWWPDVRLEAWQRFARDQEIVAGRPPTSLEARGFETMRLAGVCGEEAQRGGRSYRSALEDLRQTSVYGGTLRMERHQNSSLRLLAWDGRRFLETVIETGEGGL